MDLVAVYFNDFQQTAFVQEGGTVAQAADNAHFVGNDDDGYVETSVDVFQTLQNAARSGGVEGGSGFVGEDDLRLRRQRAGNADTLFLTAGKLGRVMVGTVLQVDDFQTFFNTRLDFFRRPFGNF